MASKEYKPDYRRLTKHKLKVSQLDKMAEGLFSASSGIFGKICSVILLIGYFAYLWTRRRLVKDEMLVEKQIFEQKQTASDKDEFDNDNLD